MTLTDRFTSFVRYLEDNIINRVMAVVLRSPLHPLLSWKFILLAYEGRKSGRQYVTPVLYWQTEDGIVLLTPADRTNWWRNFSGGHSLKVLIRGRWRTGMGEVDADEEHVFAHLTRLVSPVRNVSNRLPGRQFPSDAYIRQAGTGLVLVRVTFETENTNGEYKHG